MLKLLSAAILAACIAVPASAQDICLKREQLRVLTDKLGTELTFAGVHANGTKYLIFTNQQTGYWLAVKQGDTMACVLVEGPNFGLTVSKK